MKELTKIEEILLLAIWKLKENAYGVKIRQHVSNVIKKEFTYGNLYSALNQLERKEYVYKRPGEITPNRRGRPKVIYTVSDLGFEALKASYEMNEAMWEGITKYALDNKQD
ncbi:MAG: hypothetical protein A2V66_07665 [Ignavibacteria bacterium RBG_13_36_8]|nr:MAG: hypothetical protein A2V66_07665 [Ignavibacteria bacterium RBG_13_36_8]